AALQTLFPDRLAVPEPCSVLKLPKILLLAWGAPLAFIGSGGRPRLDHLKTSSRSFKDPSRSFAGPSRHRERDRESAREGRLGAQQRRRRRSPAAAVKREGSGDGGGQGARQRRHSGKAAAAVAKGPSCGGGGGQGARQQRRWWPRGQTAAAQWEGSGQGARLRRRWWPRGQATAGREIPCAEDPVLLFLSSASSGQGREEPSSSARRAGGSKVVHCVSRLWGSCPTEPMTCEAHPFFFQVKESRRVSVSLLVPGSRPESLKVSGLGLQLCGLQEGCWFVSTILDLVEVERQLDLSSVAARLKALLTISVVHCVSRLWGSCPTEPVTCEAHPFFQVKEQEGSRPSSSSGQHHSGVGPSPPVE
ncbi:hypothetical protein Taro_041206, partial [Colocasia esculenta]|nr:hypothetical protein [Colocasia esculenta]